MKYLHIWNFDSPKPLRCIGCNERLIRTFNPDEHVLYINGPKVEWGGNEPEKLEIHYEDKSASDKEKMTYLYNLVKNVDCVVFHSLYDADIWRLKLWKKVQDELNVKFIWAIWGHDVYDAYWRAHKGPGKHIIRYIKVQQKEKLRREIIKNMDCIMAIPGDYAAAKKWYDTSAKYVMFNQVSYGGNDLLELPENHNDVLKVVVGHDAYPHCRHKESFDILKKYDDGKMEVYCPLPYKGDEPALVKEVISYGQKLFGNRFKPMISHMKYADYCKFVNSMDVAFYNHNRQMAEGNVLMYLYYGKKVFVSKENCIGEFFKGLGADIFSVSDLNEKELFEPLDTESKKKNRDVIRYNLSDEAFKKTWQEAFDSIR